MALSTGNQIVANGLILHLDALNHLSYPGSGTTWFDLSGNSINGTLSVEAMATATPGIMRLNNSTDSIAFGHNSILEPPSLTIGAWINLLNRGDRHILITKWYGWSFEISAARYPYLRIYGTDVYDLTSTIPINWGQWHYILSTFDSINNIRNMYIDGEPAGSVADTGTISYNQGTFNIPYTNNPAYGYGNVAILHIYNRALNTNEAKQNFNALKGRFGV